MLWCGITFFQIGFSFVWRIEVSLDFGRTIGGKEEGGARSGGGEGT